MIVEPVVTDFGLYGKERGSKHSEQDCLRVCVCVRTHILPVWLECVLLVEVEQDLCSAAVSEASQGLESRIKAGTKRETEN